MNELFKTLFGNYTYIQMFGYLWFFIIGYIIYGLSETTNRDVGSIKTPQKWSWKFWWKDNRKRYLATLLSTYILFRFYVELSGHQFSEIEALMLGLLGDGIGKSLKDRVGIISANREKIMEKYNEENIG
jgi:hypothetical protein